MNESFRTVYKKDLKQYPKRIVYLTIWHLLFRTAQTCSVTVLKLFFKSIFRLHSRRHGIEIPSCTKIGGGLFLSHPYNITVNGSSVIGRCCHLSKGVTIGLEPRGKRMGTPRIGDYVHVCVNATIVGNITIGDDVLIAPGAFVNCDVPSHSVVVGNPCIIHHRDNAVENYIQIQ